MIELDKVEYCRRLGFIDETAYRNYMIRKEHDKLLEQGWKSKDAIEELSKRCWNGTCLSYFTIKHHIIYGGKKSDV